MISYKLDNITKQDGVYVAYIQILEDNKIIETECLVYDNADDFKIKFKNKVIKIKSDHDEKENKKNEIKKALRELEAE